MKEQRGKALGSLTVPLSTEAINSFLLSMPRNPLFPTVSDLLEQTSPPPNVIWHLEVADRIVVSGLYCMVGHPPARASYWTSRLEAGSLPKIPPRWTFAYHHIYYVRSTGATELSRPWVAPSGGVRSASERQR